MPKLNQLLAIEKQTKENTRKQLTALYQQLQKTTLTVGLTRLYSPIDDEGEKFPDEVSQVQIRVPEVLQEVSRLSADLFNVTFCRDLANCEAKADIEIDGQVILADVPATYLLWLEKQLTDIHTVVVALPTLSADHTWEFDENQNCYRSESSERAKTKKVPKPFVKAEATKEHPAQVDVVHDDVVTGYWQQTSYSGALPRKEAQALRERVEKLLAATKMAREKANLVDAPKMVASKAIFEYLFPKD